MHTTKHKTLRGRFEKFLVKKGYDLTDFVEDVGPDHEIPDMWLQEGNDSILMVELITSEASLLFSDAINVLNTYQNKDKSIPAYIAVWADNDYGFEIYSASGKAKPKKISHDEFPGYKDLIKPSKGASGGSVNNLPALRDDFMIFLMKEKGFDTASLQRNDTYIVGGGRRCGLEIFGEGKILAVIEFGLSEDYSVVRSAFNSFQAYMDDETDAKARFYLVLPDIADLGEQFDIHEFDMTTREEVGIFCKDFPHYEDYPPVKKSAIFKFRSGVDLDGSEILNKIIDLAGDSNFGLYAEDVDESHVNLKLEGAKKTDNIAVQIHKYGENETVIALVIAGPRKGVEVPEPELNDFIDKGKITELRRL